MARRNNMIPTLFLNALFFIVDGIVSQLPVAQALPSQIGAAFTYVIVQISQWTFIFPITTVLLILGYTVSIELVLWGFHGGVWVYKRIRGS